MQDSEGTVNGIEFIHRNGKVYVEADAYTDKWISGMAQAAFPVLVMVKSGLLPTTDPNAVQAITRAEEGMALEQWKLSIVALSKGEEITVEGPGGSRTFTPDEHPVTSFTDLSIPDDLSGLDSPPES